MEIQNLRKRTELSLFFVGREKKVQAAFRPLVLLRWPRGSSKTGTERLHEGTGEACPLGEDWSGRVVRLPQGLGNA